MARNTVGGILPASQRGQYGVRGTPTGSALRPGWAQGRNVLAGQIFTGQGGRRWVFRPQGPGGAGWYRQGSVPGSAPGAPSPTQAGSPLGGFPAGSVPASADQFTLPPVAPPAPTAVETPAAAPPPTPAPPPAWTPDPNWWLQQFTGTNEYLLQAPQISARENQIASEYGYQIRRDTTQGSPTFGQALYRVRNADAGTGTIRAFLEAVPGSVPPVARYVYRDAEGKEYAPGDLEMDVIALKPGEAGYREGSLGRTQMESRARQADIGTQMAQRGLRRSGIRASAATGEVQNLLDALRALSVEAGGEFAGTQARWMDLFNQIYPGLAESAQSLYEGSLPKPAEPPADGGDGGAPAPSVPPVPQPGPSFEAPNGITYGAGDQIAAGPGGVGMFTKKATPGGKPPKKPKDRELYRGPNGVWFVWRPNGPQGKGWYRFAPAAPGAPSPTQAGVTTRT